MRDMEYVVNGTSIECCVKLQSENLTRGNVGTHGNLFLCTYILTIRSWGAGSSTDSENNNQL